jgi:hypothetical protein
MLFAHIVRDAVCKVVPDIFRQAPSDKPYGGKETPNYRANLTMITNIYVFLFKLYVRSQVNKPSINLQA